MRCSGHGACIPLGESGQRPPCDACTQGNARRELPSCVQCSGHGAYIPSVESEVGGQSPPAMLALTGMLGPKGCLLLISPSRCQLMHIS